MAYISRRNTSIELLRLISMLMIVLFHLNRIGFYEAFANLGSWSKAMFEMVTSWGILGVNCFVIITSFFLKDKTTPKAAKALDVIIQTYVYIIAFELIRLIVIRPGLTEWSGELLRDILLGPLMIRNYWFCWAYVALILLIPYLNQIRMDSLLFKAAVTLFLVGNFVSVYSFLADVLCFVLVYLISKWLFSHPGNIVERNKYALLLFVVAAVLVLNLCEVYIGKDSDLTCFLSQFVSKGRYSVLMYLGAISLFYVFLDFRMPESQLINWMARYSLGIYLIHECAVFHVSAYIPFVLKDYLGIWSTLIMSTIIIFVLGIGVHYVYDNLYKRLPYDRNQG